ncbi:unnamed protein product [Cunninghamella echinulata]
MFNQFKEQAAKAVEGASVYGQKAFQGASTIGNQAFQSASTYGNQAGRNINSFAEKNNINTPITGTLYEESAKAAKILQSFVDKDEMENGFDNIIPVKVIQEAKGLAIFTVIKAGFLFSGKVGSGIVVSRLSDGRWSAPSAIATGGIGVGFQAGTDITSVVLILNSEEAVDAFCKGENLTVGGSLAVSLGPLGAGTSAEAAGDIGKKKLVPMFSYTKSKGLFAGMSVEGTGLFELTKTNTSFYGKPVKAAQILKGEIEPPNDAEQLYTTIRYAENRDPY